MEVVKFYATEEKRQNGKRRRELFHKQNIQFNFPSNAFQEALKSVIFLTYNT